MTAPILASILAACLLSLIAAFQALLALGMPFGNAAWGGMHRVLPPHLRIASAISVAPLALAVWIILSSTGIAILPWQPATRRTATWIGFALLALNTLGNLASKSRSERMLMTPIAGVCAVCFLLVALADTL